MAFLPIHFPVPSACMEYLADDELLEVTPKSLRMRKRLLDHSARMRAASKAKS